VQPPQVIASDLDGTLLGPGSRLSERTRGALTAAREHGLAVVAVTARTPYGVELLPELIPLLDTAICANGAVFYEPAEARTHIRHAIEPETARQVCAALAEALPGASLAVETGVGIVGNRRHYDGIVSDMSHWEFVDSDEEMLARVDTIVKIKAFDPSLHSEEMLGAIDGVELAELDMCHWGDFGMLDFNAPGVNKATGLAAWCAERGLGAEEVVAFGDMPNDVPMLAWAGRSYAVAGAHPEALAAAGDVTASNADDGVARVVESIVDGIRAAA
jgi:Cof subfamily protein (haloacid dehalogenase superfamily)